MPFTEDIGLDS